MPDHVQRMHRAADAPARIPFGIISTSLDDLGKTTIEVVSQFSADIVEDVFDGGLPRLLRTIESIPGAPSDARLRVQPLIRPPLPPRIAE